MAQVQVTILCYPGYIAAFLLTDPDFQSCPIQMDPSY